MVREEIETQSTDWDCIVFTLHILTICLIRCIKFTVRKSWRNSTRIEQMTLAFYAVIFFSNETDIYDLCLEIKKSILSP